MFNLRAVTNVLGVQLLVVATLMAFTLPFSIYYQDGQLAALLLSTGITASLGTILWRYKYKKNAAVHRREGYLIVVLGWLCMVIVGTFPYMISGAIPSFTNAFFETMSGMTTTGASILSDIEAVPKSILFWRSMTQWIGGMGIIVLTVAIFPLLGIGGIELFVAEAPGPTSDKIHPRIQETAKTLWFIYVGLTAVLMLILWALGMSFFDAVNHALTTMATGGFSTKNASMAYFDIPSIQYVITLFMFIAGTNYTIIYFSLNGRLKKVWSSDEFKLYLGLVLCLTAIFTIVVFQGSDLGFEKSFRDSIFQIVSLITTTGFVSADYTAWHPALTLLCFALLFVGASAGSTSGGIKLVRHYVFFKSSLLEFKKILHPRAVIPIKINKHVVSDRVRSHILNFLLVYLLVFALGALAMTLVGMDFDTALGAAATSLGNVGPGIGNVGPVDNFAWIPTSGKWILTFLMLMGRLELFTVLVVFSTYFWKSN